MKIGLVIDDSLDKTDGVQQYVTTVGRWLSGKGHEVHYLTSKTRRQDIARIHSLAPNLNLKFNQNRVGTPLPAPKKLLQNLLAREQFDVLHFQLPHSPLLAGRIIKLAPPRTALIGTFHILPYSNYQASAARLLANIVKNDWPRFSGLISVSAAARDFAKQCFQVDSVVIPNCVDLSRFHPPPKTAKDSLKRPLKLIFLGRLVPRKGALELLKAFQLLGEKTGPSSKITLTIGGDGPERAKLKRFCERFNLSQVKFAGFIPEAEKPSFLAEADIAVFPSLGGESFGIVLLEAMAAGTLAVGGDNPGYSGVLGQWPECLADPKDPLLFSKKLQALISNSKLCQRLHSAQQAALKSYDIEIIGPRLVDVYDQAIAKTGLKKDNV